MSLSDEQIARMGSLERYWPIAQKEVEETHANNIRALANAPRHSLPFFSISDYEKAKKGIIVPIEEPRPTPIGFIQRTDNRSINQYMSNEPASSPALTISQYLEGIGDPIPLYMTR